MRKPRDYDAELKTLSERAAQLKSRKVQQLGELVIATGAETLPVEILAGALIAAAREKDAAAREGWRKAGTAFFQRASRAAANRIATAPGSSGTLPPDRGTGAS